MDPSAPLTSSDLNEFLRAVFVTLGTCAGISCLLRFYKLLIRAGWAQAEQDFLASRFPEREAPPSLEDRIAESDEHYRHILSLWEESRKADGDDRKGSHPPGPGGWEGA